MVGIKGRTAIIGAGMTGLACAGRLAENGHRAVIFDKGRGLGGRLSTRRADGGLQFDHGAQYITAEDPGFAALLARAEAGNAIAQWPQSGEKARFVGLPGMSGLAKYLANGLEVRRNVEINRIEETARGWQVSSTNGSEAFDRLILTVPAPQAAGLLGDAHQAFGALRDVEMDPCWTLMLALAEGAKAPAPRRSDPADPIAWLALDSDKPARPDAGCYVAQASADWSRAHLELDRDEIARLLLPMVARHLETELEDLRYLAAHRWRYARASRPLGQAFVSNEGNTLFIGGDWCLGDKVEDAWASGTAIAQAVIEMR